MGEFLQIATGGRFASSGALATGPQKYLLISTDRGGCLSVAMNAVFRAAPSGLRLAFAAALAALSLPAIAEVTTIIRYRSGNKDTVVAPKSGITGTVNVQYTKGTATAKAMASLTTIPGFDLVEVFNGLPPVLFRRGPVFKATAEGVNPRDTTPPSGKESDRLNTVAQIRLNETLTVSDANDFGLSFDIHGTVTASGANGAGFARAQLLASSGLTVNSYDGSSDNPDKFNGTKLHIDVPFMPLPLLSKLMNYEIFLLAVTNTSIYKANSAKADAGTTVTMTGITIRNADGKRIEAPDLMSKSGFDYSPILNLPTNGSGPGEFAFASEALIVQEDGGTALLRINRNGGSDGDASVVVRNVTVPPEGEDFEPFATTLNFAEGETEKHVLVRILNDGDLTNVGSTHLRTFDIELADATGGALAATGAAATVTISDEDTAWTAPDAGPQTLAAWIHPNGGDGEKGLMTFSVTAAGNATFSGILRGKRFAGSGKATDLDFSGGGKTVNVPGIGAVKFTLLRYKNIKGVPRLLGKATLPDSTELAIRGVAVFSTDKTQPKTSKRGAYTLLLEPPPGADAAAPKGTGFATVTVSDNGKTVIAGKLADGTALTAGGTLNVLAELPLLLSLPGKRGELSGTLKFRYAPATSDLDASLRWTRPGSTVKGPFMGGFATTLAATGSRFYLPANGSFLLPRLTTDSDDAVFRAEGPDLSAPVARQVTIGPAPLHKVTPESTAEKLSIRMVGRTGLWSGTFRDGTKTVTFQGALHQLTDRGAGYFLGATQSGQVSLQTGALPP
jgi:hypothetical protein